MGTGLGRVSCFAPRQRGSVPDSTDFFPEWKPKMRPTLPHPNVPSKASQQASQWVETSARNLRNPASIAALKAVFTEPGNVAPPGVDLFDPRDTRDAFSYGERAAGGLLVARRAHKDEWHAMKAMIDKAEAEGRDLTAEEQRRYDQHEAVLDQLADLIDVVQAQNDRSVNPMGTSAYVANRPLSTQQTFLGAVRAQDPYNDTPEDLSLGKIVKAMITGDWRGADREAASVKNAMSGAGAGGVLLPTTTSARIIDLARNKCRVLEAGGQIVPMDDRTVVVPRWTGDPALAWRAENAAIAEVDGAMDSVTLTAKTLAAVVRISRELVETPTSKTWCARPSPRHWPSSGTTPRCTGQAPTNPPASRSTAT